VAPKAGIFTTEFWLTLATVVSAALGFIKLPPVLIVILVAAYGAFRTIVKVLAPSFTIPAWLQKIIDAITAQQQPTPPAA
jgi:hypothetical protein